MSAEPKVYTAREIARMTALVAKSALYMSRGWSTTKIDQQIEQLKADAVARETAEQAARDKARQDKIEARAAKRAASTWW
jgi:hypothetical protein